MGMCNIDIRNHYNSHLSAEYFLLDRVKYVNIRSVLGRRERTSKSDRTVY